MNIQEAFDKFCKNPSNFDAMAILSGDGVGDAPEGIETAMYTYVDKSGEFTESQYEYLRSRDLAVDEAQYTPRPGVDF